MYYLWETTVCAFGIGADFDEKLMKGIAEVGAGDYFFIESAESINRLVGKAMRGFNSVFGVNTKLIVQGENGGVGMYKEKDVRHMYII